MAARVPGTARGGRAGAVRYRGGAGGEAGAAVAGKRHGGGERHGTRGSGSARVRVGLGVRVRGSAVCARTAACATGEWGDAVGAGGRVAWRATDGTAGGAVTRRTRRACVHGPCATRCGWPRQARARVRGEGAVARGQAGGGGAG
jgi:hypothetical protein